MFAAFNLGANPVFRKTSDHVSGRRYHVHFVVNSDIHFVRRAVCTDMKRKAESHGLAVSAGMPYAVSQAGAVVAGRAGKKQPWRKPS